MNKRGGEVTILQHEGRFTVGHEWHEHDQGCGFSAVCWAPHGSYPTLIEAVARAREVAERQRATFVEPLWEREVEYDMGPASDAPDLRGKNFEDAVELVVDWFHSNFEDPAENMPFESAEGGYYYIWGGPYEAREEIDGAFGYAISEAVLEEAVTQIEYDGWDWAPSSSRMRPDGIAP